MIDTILNFRSEMSFDRMLKIKTTGRDDTGADDMNYPYEPTPYSVLQRVSETGLIGKKNHLLDYGCGKGRVSFFLSYQTGCRCTGVELNERLYKKALQNKETAVSGNKCSFLMENAASFEVPSEIDRAFFFNPFSVKVLKPVIYRLKASCRINPREIRLFFYFPSLEYTGYLMQEESLMFEDELDTSDLFYENQKREKVQIYRMNI